MSQKKEGVPMTNLCRHFTLNRSDMNADTRTLTLSFASEEPYERWFGPEVLQIDKKAVDLSRFENGLGCLLYNHNRDAVIGHIERAWIDGAKAYAEVRFDEDEKAELIYQKVMNGTLQGVSVGYVVREYTEVKKDGTMKTETGEIKGPCYVATKWEALEVSVVSVPADASVGVGRAMEEEFNRIVIRDVKEDIMEETKEVVTVVDEVATEEAVKAERERCEQITALCRHFNVEAEAYIMRGLSLAEVQKDVLAKASAFEPPKATIEIVSDEADVYRAAATDAMLMRAGIPVEKPAEGASELRGLSLKALMTDVVSREGTVNAHRLDEEQLMKAALTGTGALPGILSNVANKSLARAYEAAPTTYQYFTSTGSNPDFKDATVYRLSEAGALEEIKENGEFIHDEIGESEAKKRVLTFGRSFSFTRQMIVNDDLSVLTRIPALYAAAAKRGINRLVYQMLSADINFTKKAGNLATTGAELSLETIEAGRVAMRTQKNLRGEEVLNITPKFLLVPTGKEFLARQLLTSTSDPNATHAGVINPLYNSLQIISDAELDAINTDAWYLAADPMLMDTIEVTYLNGKQTPTIESQIAFDTLGIRYRVYMDYGVTVLDKKGIYKNAGK